MLQNNRRNKTINSHLEVFRTYKELKSLLPFGYIKTKVSESQKYSFAEQPIFINIEKEKEKDKMETPTKITNNLFHNKNIYIFSDENENFKKLMSKFKEFNSYYKLNKIHSIKSENNFDKSLFEAKLSKEIIEELDKIKKSDIEEEENELKEELSESEKNNYEGYIFKYNNGKMVKIWVKLYYKDYYYYKKKEDKQHIGMHNLSGLFFKEEPTKDYEEKTYYSFSIVFPSKTHTYFSDNQIEYNNWVKYLQIATNYSNILEIYQITDELGSGSFSTVRLGINKYTQEKVAIKIMDKQKMSTIRLESARREIEIMKICQHPNIIHYIDSYENENNIYIFMEYCEGGTFFDFLKKRNFILKEDLAVNIIYQICKAIDYFHSYGITHRDLKPENILMTSEHNNTQIKILDFGLGKIIGPNEKCSEPYGTVAYCAPEIIQDFPYSKNVDSWSLGVITYIILYGRFPFYDEDKNKKMQLKIIKTNPVYKSFGINQVSDEAKNFIQNLLIKDQDKRMTIQQALKHKWFQKYKLSDNLNG